MVRRVGHAPGHGEANRAASALGRSRTRAVPLGRHRRRRPRRSAHRARGGCRRTPPAPPHRSLGHRSCRASRRRPRPHQPRRQPAVPGRAAGPCRRGRRACRHASASAAGGPVLDRTPPVPAVGRRQSSRARPPTLPRSVSLEVAEQRALSRAVGAAEVHATPRRPRGRGTRASASRGRGNAAPAPRAGSRRRTRGRRRSSPTRAERRPHRPPRHRRRSQRPRPRACDRAGIRERGASIAPRGGRRARAR